MSASAVDRASLGPDLSISRVATGLWQIADMERGGQLVDASAASAAMRPYVEAGITTFDMADHYGSAEEVVGRFVAGGGRAEILTKWVPKPGPVTREDVRVAVGRALDRLRVPRVDLLQFHAWNYADPRWLDCLFWVQDLKRAGLLRHIGVTNFDAAHMRVALTSGIEIVSNQVCFSLLDARPKRHLVRLCAERGVGLLAYGTMAGGFLTERWVAKDEPDWEKLPTWSLLKYGRFIRAAGGWKAFQALLQALAAVAHRHGVSIANVASRAILDEPGVAAIIVGARLGVASHIDETLRLFRFSLDASDRAVIENATSSLQPIPGEPGDEYRKPPFLTASGDLSHHLDDLPPPYVARSAPGRRTFVLSGTAWEPIAGFSRAVRVGDSVHVSGTTATHGDLAIGGNDPAAQTHFVIDKIEGALASLGARLADVVRTRVYVRRIEDWEAVARAHGERFGGIQPANTLVQAALVGEEYLVEVEADAVIPSEEPDPPNVPPESLVTVGRYFSPAEAHLARMAVQEGGIEAFLFDENVGASYGFGVGARLAVRPSDEASARAVLASSAAPASALPPDIAEPPCPSCGAADVASLRRLRDDRSEWIYRCSACGREWLAT